MVTQFAKILILGGTLLILIGIVFLFGSKIPYFGKLPGDIYIKRENFTFFCANSLIPNFKYYFIDHSKYNL